MPQYSIVVCNLNMVKTVERSLRSILNQTGNRYEILVVDGGSTDGSLRTLQQLSNQFERLRVICSVEMDTNTLGADRNIGVREARGEHVLVQLDADDKFESVIDDFVAIYEELRAHQEDDFYLSGHGINVAPRDFLLSYGPYRERIHRGEDADMWRRMLSDDALIQLKHRPVCTPIGYEPDASQLLQQRLSEIEGDLMSGVSLWSRMRQAIVGRPLKMAIAELGLIPFAAARVSRRERYSLPEPYDDACKLSSTLTDIEQSVSDFQQMYPSFSVKLSDLGQTIFLY